MREDIWNELLGGVPDTYLAVDCEFLPGTEDSLVLLEVGHAMVSQGKVIDRLSVVLNCFAENHGKSSEFSYRLSKLSSHMGPGWRLTAPYIQREGKDPRKVLPKYFDVLNQWADSGHLFIAHNGIAADERSLRAAFRQYDIADDFRFPGRQYLDTGAVFLAHRLLGLDRPEYRSYRKEAQVKPNETSGEYSRRLLGLRIPGLKWSVSEAVSVLGVDMSDVPGDAHAADYDSVCIHRVLQKIVQKTKGSSEFSIATGADLQKIADVMVPETAEERKLRDSRYNPGDQVKSQKGTSNWKKKRRRRQRNI